MTNTVKEKREQIRREAREELKRKHPGLRDVLVEFQPDAVEIEQRSIPGGARWTLYTVFALIGAFCIWAYWAEVDRIVQTQGKLIAEQAIVVQTASTAPIRSVNVQFGATVRAGDLLATLDPTFSDADVAQLVAQLESYTAHYQRLKAEAANLPFEVGPNSDKRDWQIQLTAYLERQKEYQSKLDEFISAKSKLIVQKNNNELESQNQELTLKTLNKLFDRYLRLTESNNMSEVKLFDVELQVEQAKTQIATLAGKSKEFDADMESLKTQVAAFEASWRAEVAKNMVEIGQKISDTEQNLHKAQRSQELVEIRVPKDTPYDTFYVLEVAERSAGSVVQPGEPLFKLVPINSPLEVEIDIAGKDIGLIKEGDDVRLKLSSFPYQRHGFLSGKLRTISEDSFEKETSPGMPPISTYRARVTLTDQFHLEHVPDNFRLLPGMAVDAEVVVGTRRVYEYFLYPLIRALDDSVREP